MGREEDSSINYYLGELKPKMHASLTRLVVSCRCAFCPKIYLPAFDTILVKNVETFH